MRNNFLGKHNYLVNTAVLPSFFAEKAGYALYNLF